MALNPAVAYYSDVGSGRDKREKPTPVRRSMLTPIKPLPPIPPPPMPWQLPRQTVRYVPAPRTSRLEEGFRGGKPGPTTVKPVGAEMPEPPPQTQYGIRDPGGMPGPYSWMYGGTNPYGWNPVSLMPQTQERFTMAPEQMHENQAMQGAYGMWYRPDVVPVPYAGWNPLPTSSYEFEMTPEQMHSRQTEQGPYSMWYRPETGQYQYGLGARETAGRTLPRHWDTIYPEYEIKPYTDAFTGVPKPQKTGRTTRSTPVRAVNPDYNPAMPIEPEEVVMYDGYPYGGYSGYPRGYGGYGGGYPYYQSTGGSREDVKSWYENMMNWNIR